jgi:DNA-binding transcriptional LysR family regulator
MFQDDLLVRSPNAFELTLRGRKILDELEELLPKMEHLVAPLPLIRRGRRATSTFLFQIAS